MDDESKGYKKTFSVQEKLGTYSNSLYIHTFYKFTDQDGVVTFYHAYEMKDAPWYNGTDFDMSGLDKCNKTKKGEKQK